MYNRDRSQSTGCVMNKGRQEVAWKESVVRRIMGWQRGRGGEVMTTDLREAIMKDQV